MGHTVEQREVAELRDVDVFTCDVCGKETTSIHVMPNVPAGWITVSASLEHRALLCSDECLRQWVSGAAADLTKIAREQFAKTTGTG